MELRGLHHRKEAARRSQSGRMPRLPQAARQGELYVHARPAHRGGQGEIASTRTALIATRMAPTSASVARATRIAYEQHAREVTPTRSAEGEQQPVSLAPELPQVAPKTA